MIFAVVNHTLPVLLIPTDLDKVRIRTTVAIPEEHAYVIDHAHGAQFDHNSRIIVIRDAVACVAVLHVVRCDIAIKQCGTTFALNATWHILSGGHILLWPQGGTMWKRLWCVALTDGIEYLVRFQYARWTNHLEQIIKIHQWQPHKWDNGFDINIWIITAPFPDGQKDLYLWRKEAIPMQYFLQGFLEHNKNTVIYIYILLINPLHPTLSRTHLG